MDDSSQIEVDMEQVISEIRDRPPLYNNTQPKIKGDKDKLWEEVCLNVLLNWEEMTAAEKNNAMRKIKSKWKNVKDNFKREVELLKMANLKGKPIKKRRKYVYFNSLSFLKPYLSERNRNQEPANYNSNRTYQTLPKLLLERIDEPPTRDVPIKEVTYFEEKMINIMESFQRRDIDEDESFLMSLLPSFQKFDDGQKYAARIEILGVLRRVKLRELEIP